MWGPGCITETWELLFGSGSSGISTFSKTRKRKHKNNVKCKMTQTYNKAGIEVK